MTGKQTSMVGALSSLLWNSFHHGRHIFCCNVLLMHVLLIPVFVHI